MMVNPSRGALGRVCELAGVDFSDLTPEQEQCIIEECRRYGRAWAAFLEEVEKENTACGCTPKLDWELRRDEFLKKVREFCGSIEQEKG